MAKVTISNNRLLPTGTAVSCYPTKGYERWPGFPPGSAVTTGTVTGGAVELSGLVPGRTYFVVGDNDAVVNIVAPKQGDVIPTVTGERDDPEAALKNLLAGGDDAGLWVDSTTAS